MSPELVKVVPISEWLHFELATKLINPPELKVRIKPIHSINALGFYKESDNIRDKTNFIVECVIDALVDWDLSEKGKKLEFKDVETKRAAFEPLLGEKLKDKNKLFGMELFLFACNADNFIKN